MPLNLISQNNSKTDLEKLYSQEKYQEIIDLKPNQDWNGKAYYYRAMAHYMKNDDDNTIKFMNIAIEKGPVDHDMYYYKAMSFFYKSEYKKSLPLLKKSIEMLPDEPAFYKSIGDVFYNLKEIDSSYSYLKKAISFENATIDIYSTLAELCFEMEKYNEALTIYEKIIIESEPNSEQHHLYLYNISLIQQLAKEFENAEMNLNNILKIYPNDFQAKTKLIQVLVAQDKYDEAYKFRTELYLAYKQNELPPEFNDRFCFEQFDWNKNKVFGYESFKNPEDSEETLFNKHQFFVYDKNGKYLYQINSESSFAVRQNKSIEYVLALKNDRGYQTFWQFGFKEIDYKELKKNVLKILNQEAKPGSSTIIN